MPNPIGKNQYGDDVYDTPNGQKTGTQITQELQAAGWGGSGDPVSVYNQTAAGSAGGGGGGGGGGSSGGGGGGGSSSDPYGGDYANYQNNSLLLQGANNAAQAAYNQGMLKFNNDKLAFDMATQAFNNAISAAGLTGMYQGAPTIPAMQQYANTFGTWGVPTQGQQTLAGQQQGFNQQQALAQMYGQYYAPGQAPTAGQSTQAAQQQQFGQWATAQGLAQTQWQQQQQAAQAYMTMMAGLRGPADYAKYQQVLGSTPGGMTDLVRAAAGQYIPGGGATTGVAPTPVTMQSFYNQLTGGQQAPAGQLSTQQMMQGFQQPQGQQNQAATNAQMYQPGGQSQYYNPANQMAPSSVNWQSGQYARSGVQQPGQTGDPAQAQQQFMMNQGTPQMPGGQQYQGANAPGGTQQNAQATMDSLVAPNQMAPQTWANLTPSQQQMLLGTWESKGYTKDDAQALFTQSLPKYASQSAGAGSFRLQ